MRKIFIVLAMVMLFSRVEAQPLNVKSAVNFVDKVEEFTSDINYRYHLQLTTIYGNGRFTDGNSLIVKQDNKRIDANIVYHRKFSFVWFHVYIGRVSIKEKTYENNLHFFDWTEKDYYSVMFDRTFEPYEGAAIVFILEDLFESLGF